MDNIYRLGVISDTHICDPEAALELAQQLLAGPFAGVDAILHAGDLTIPDIESCFGLMPIYAVQGNMDSARLGLPFKRVIKIAGYRIGLIHGWGYPSAVAANVQSEFAAEQLDLLVFGHSHCPFDGLVASNRLFNPGSATEHRGRAAGCTVGLIELGDELRVRHLPFDFKWTDS